MAAPKRTRTQREKDLVEVARQYLTGRTQQEIADAIGVSRQQVGYDIAALLKRWRAEMLSDIDEHQARELAKLHRIEIEWWTQWERSTTDGKPGNAEYLRGAERCSEQRRKLLGLDKPVKIAPTDPTGDRPYEPLTDTERAERLAILLERVKARREQQETLSAAEQ